MSESVEYQIGLPEKYRRSAAELYEEAFRQKFLPIVKSEEKMVEILTDSIDIKYAVSAMQNGILLGIAGFHGSGGHFTGKGGAADVISRLGLVRGIWAIIIFGILFERKPAPGELLMDGIAVQSSHRGKGIGTGLINKLCEYAQQQGYKTVRLDVVDINAKARRLYENLGFKAVKTEDLAFLKKYLGFSSSTTMVKEL